MVFVDILIILILGLYGYFGYRNGFLASMAELVAFILGIAIAFAAYKPLGGVIFDTFRMPRGMADLMGFLVIWTVLEVGFSLAWRKVRSLIPEDLAESPANRITGIFPSLVKGIFLITIILLIVAVAPITSAAKDPIVKSTLGQSLLGVGTAFQQQFNNLFGQALRDTLAFRTIKTGSDETTALGFSDANPRVCARDEQRLLDLANQERLRVGLRALAQDDQLREVGRAHSKDMLARGYFSHNTPEGLDPFDRMEQAGITYRVAGENLAFAPTVEIAHSGLMNSPGHRANILKPEFTRLGVGCMDAAIRGKMFSQEFKG
jgi:uncharacterized protein YkwD